MAKVELPDFNKKCVLNLIESITTGDKKNATKALKMIVANNIKQKLHKAANEEHLI